MRKCGYCGRENDDGARTCKDCGTEFEDEAEVPMQSRAALEKPTHINLQEIDGAFTTRDGFSRPCWLAIHKAVRRSHSADEQLAAWLDVMRQWASRWETELGNEFWTAGSGRFFLLSQLGGEIAERILEEANRMAGKITGVLGSVAWENRPYILTAHVADEALGQRFDEAVSSPENESDAEHMARRHSPSWIFVSSEEEASMIYEIESALVWNCLSHLSLPRWLACGTAGHLQRLIESARNGRARELFDADLIPEHRQFWNGITIQSFWAGTCETEYPKKANLFFELSNILLQFVSEKTKSLVDYLRCAHQNDGGQAAAQVCLKTGLGELATTFLGPGDWSPDLVAIVECWDRVREMNSGRE